MSKLQYAMIRYKFKSINICPEAPSEVPAKARLSVRVRHTMYEEKKIEGIFLLGCSL